MIRTDSEAEYLTAMSAEFGMVFGSNVEYSRVPCRRVTRPGSLLNDDERKQILEMRLRHVPYKVIERQFLITSTAIWEIQRDAGYQWPNCIGNALR